MVVDEITMREALKEMVHSDKSFITPAEAAPLLGSSAQDIRVAARQRPDMIHFPFTFVGSRMKIPRIPFLEFLIGAERIEELKAEPYIPVPIDTVPITEVTDTPQEEVTAPTASTIGTKSKWELFTTRTFTQEDGEVLWEVSIKGWRKK